MDAERRLQITHRDGTLTVAGWPAPLDARQAGLGSRRPLPPHRPRASGRRHARLTARNNRTMNETEAIYQAAMAEHRAKRLDAAEPLYRQALARDPAFARAWHLLGVLLHQRGDSLTGLAYVEQAIRLEPQWAVLYSNLGSIYWATSRLAQAEQALRRAIDMAPELKTARLALGYVLAEQNRCDEAVGCFQQILAQDPADAQALAGLGHSYSELGLVHEAIAAYNRAYEAAEPAYRILAAIQLPLVYESAAEVEQWRRRLIEQIDSLLAAGVVQELNQRPATPLFSLAHQGLNDIEIQRRFTRLFRDSSASTATAGETPAPQGTQPERRTGETPILQSAFASDLFRAISIRIRSGSWLAGSSRGCRGSSLRSPCFRWASSMTRSRRKSRRPSIAMWCCREICHWRGRRCWSIRSMCWCTIR